MEQPEQLCFQWARSSETGDPNAVELDRETIDALVALMARALIAVVRAAESDDER